ncbi:MAG: hypothetical protein JSW27_20310 [Phycisphaerales bacterium]|nr:MAG: hypothetical protein JSW27_20310 [Phycisphaerales bacterium]
MTSASVAAKRLTMPEIKERAKMMGITPGKMKKAELIHAIQMAEGCTPCYGRSNGECPWLECCWRNDCFKTKA